MMHPKVHVENAWNLSKLDIERVYIPRINIAAYYNGIPIRIYNSRWKNDFRVLEDNENQSLIAKN